MRNILLSSIMSYKVKDNWGNWLNYEYLIIYNDSKTIQRHITHTIVPWPNPKQWLMVLFLVAYSDLVTSILSDCITVTVVIVSLICFLRGVVGFQSTLIVKYVIQYWNSWIWLEADRTVMDCICSIWIHGDVIKWKHFLRCWPFVRGIHWSPVNFPHKGQLRGALMFSLICARINALVNNHQAGVLRRHRAHYDVIIMMYAHVVFFSWTSNTMAPSIYL